MQLSISAFHNTVSFDIHIHMRVFNNDQASLWSKEKDGGLPEGSKISET